MRAAFYVGVLRCAGPLAVGGIELTGREFELLQALPHADGAVLRREESMHESGVSP
jgi:DNA-binding response OmpR family regulator